MTVGALLPIMFCIAAIIVAALIGLAVRLLRPARGKSKDGQSGLPPGTAKPAHKDWKSWIPYFGIVLILAIWTIWGALFFLVVVWLMRQNPGAESNLTIRENDKKTARRVYTWLFLSPILSVPVFIIALINAYNSSTDRRVLAALIPLILHLPLLLGLTSKNVFVYRHTQQGILLIALRAAMAALAVSASRHPIDGLWLFLLGNGALWLFGSIWGWNQISRSDCWLMRRRGESSVQPAEMGQELDDYLESIEAKDKQVAYEKSLRAFRTGTPELRKKAVLILSKLGEVEKF